MLRGGASLTGLSAAEAAGRLREEGPNTIPGARSGSEEWDAADPRAWMPRKEKGGNVDDVRRPNLPYAPLRRNCRCVF
jgi:hypothetical protein